MYFIKFQYTTVQCDTFVAYFLKLAMLCVVVKYVMMKIVTMPYNLCGGLCI